MGLTPPLNAGASTLSDADQLQCSESVDNCALLALDRVECKAGTTSSGGAEVGGGVVYFRNLRILVKQLGV
jgi:hypothetical protein